MYVYILKCNDNTYYVGVTNNLERRIQEHQQGIDRNSYTYLRRPVNVVFYEMFNDPSDAIAFEKKIKGWNKKKKEALINGDYQLLPELSMNTLKRHAQSSTGSD